MTIDLHFICPHGRNWRSLPGEENLFESGNWVVAEQVAEAAKGGRIYLHEHQRDPAWHGGTITAWRPSKRPGRVVFTYTMDGPFRLRCTEGWAQEKAVVHR
jgi:hypothetical protein